MAGKMIQSNLKIWASGKDEKRQTPLFVQTCGETWTMFEPTLRNGLAS
jgi:hypothetical protein